MTPNSSCQQDSASLEIMREPISLLQHLEVAKHSLLIEILPGGGQTAAVYIYNRTDAYMNSEAVTECTACVQVQADGISVLRDRDGNEPPFLTRKLSVIDNHLQRKNGFSLIESHWVY